jgi:hypothetical protein
LRDAFGFPEGGVRILAAKLCRRNKSFATDFCDCE